MADGETGETNRERNRKEGRQAGKGNLGHQGRNHGDSMRRQRNLRYACMWVRLAGGGVCEEFCCSITVGDGK